MITFVVEVDVDGGDPDTAVAELADALTALIPTRIPVVTVPNGPKPWLVTGARHHLPERVL